MISNLISFFISSRLQRAPIYEALAVQDGIHLPTAESRRGTQRQIIRIMRTAGESLPAHTTIRDAIDRIRGSSFQSWLVTDSTRVFGVVNLDRLQRELANDDSKTVGELVDETIQRAAWGAAWKGAPVHLDHMLRHPERIEKAIESRTQERSRSPGRRHQMSGLRSGQLELTL